MVETRDEKNTSSAAAPVDLTQKIAPYMDVHMMLPLLKFLDENKIYKSEDLASAKFDILKQTKLLEATKEACKEVNASDEVIAEVNTKTADAEKTEKTLQEGAETFLALHRNTEVFSALEGAQFNIAYLEETHKITPVVLEAVYAFAKFKYDRGQYAVAAPLLDAYHKIFTSSPSLVVGLDAAQLQAVNAKTLDAQWGKLACVLCLGQSAEAVPALMAVKETIDNDTTSPALLQLQRRSWLLHWALVALLALPSGEDAAATGRSALIDLFVEQRYLETIQTMCPWLLRYLTCCVVINRRRRGSLKELVRALQQEMPAYTDAITEFVDCVYLQFDFEAAQEKLKECEALLNSDYFLASSCAGFLESARLFIFETYCRIHQEVDVAMVAKKLALTDEEAERWVVELVRGARLSAHIDVKGGADEAKTSSTVVMDVHTPSVYQQVVQTTKSLTARSFALCNNLERVTQEQVEGATITPPTPAEETPAAGKAARK